MRFTDVKNKDLQAMTQIHYLFHNHQVTKLEFEFSPFDPRAFSTWMVVTPGTVCDPQKCL